MAATGAAAFARADADAARVLREVRLAEDGRRSRRRRRARSGWPCSTESRRRRRRSGTSPRVDVAWLAARIGSGDPRLRRLRLEQLSFAQRVFGRGRRDGAGRGDPGALGARSTRGRCVLALERLGSRDPAFFAAAVAGARDAAWRSRCPRTWRARTRASRARSPSSTARASAGRSTRAAAERLVRSLVQVPLPGSRALGARPRRLGRSRRCCRRSPAAVGRRRGGPRRDGAAGDGGRRDGPARGHDVRLGGSLVPGAAGARRAAAARGRAAAPGVAGASEAAARVPRRRPRRERHGVRCGRGRSAHLARLRRAPRRARRAGAARRGPGAASRVPAGSVGAAERGVGAGRAVARAGLAAGARDGARAAVAAPPRRRRAARAGARHRRRCSGVGSPWASGSRTRSSCATRTRARSRPPSRPAGAARRRSRPGSRRPRGGGARRGPRPVARARARVAARARSSGARRRSSRSASSPTSARRRVAAGTAGARPIPTLSGLRCDCRHPRPLDDSSGRRPEPALAEGFVDLGVRVAIHLSQRGLPASLAPALVSTLLPDLFVEARPVGARTTGSRSTPGRATSRADAARRRGGLARGPRPAPAGARRRGGRAEAQLARRARGRWPGAPPQGAAGQAQPRARDRRARARHATSAARRCCGPARRRGARGRATHVRGRRPPGVHARRRPRGSASGTPATTSSRTASARWRCSPTARGSSTACAPRPPASPPRWTVDVVQVAATVTDGDGRLVKGLGLRDFRIYEDERPQEVTHFIGAEAERELVVAVDMSGSMGRRCRPAARPSSASWPRCGRSTTSRCWRSTTPCSRWRAATRRPRRGCARSIGCARGAARPSTTRCCGASTCSRAIAAAARSCCSRTARTW